MVPEIDVTDIEVLADPVTAYRQARELSPLARLMVPGFPMWVMTQHASARAMLGDPRFEINANSFIRPPGIPEHCLPYLRTMSEMDGPEHLRLRRLAAPALTPRRAAEFRPQMERTVESLLDELVEHADADGSVDLLRYFARPLPIEVICELVGIPMSDRPQWREYGAAVAAGMGEEFNNAIPRILEGAKAAVARRKVEPADDLLSYLLRIQAEDGDRLSDAELVTLVWHLLLAGQTPTNLIANAMETLFAHPDQLAALRADEALMPGAVEELLRWCTPQILTTPRWAREDIKIGDEVIRKGDAVTASILSANHDSAAFTDADRFDIHRPSGAGHLAFSHGPHFCLGASLSRVEMEVALTALLHRFPDLGLAVPAEDLLRSPDGGTWRLAALPVKLNQLKRI